MGLFYEIFLMKSFVLPGIYLSAFIKEITINFVM